MVELPNGARPGARIGPYRLDRMIGEGGMGQVWLATRADGLYERKVALKLLRPGLVDPRLRQRFDREREILARFAHPYIARLLDAGIDRDGQPYLALEYVDGEAITTYCQSRQLDLAARIDLFRQVCEAVSHAHANLIVHRDLKPSNILVTPAGHVRLLDFGIAKLLDVEPLPLEQTRTGVRTFTLHYAAPEQIRGEPVTTMTDVYSLGVVLYELFTGSKPYRLKRQTDAEWEEAILDGEPLRASQAALRSDAEATRPYSPKRLSRELSGDLDNIVNKALGKRPEQRYVSAEALSQDLLCYLRGRPIQARGERMGYRVRKYLYRHRWPVAAASMVLAVMLTALAVVGWQARQALREAGRAQAMQNFVAALFESAGSAPHDTPMDLRALLDMGIMRGERSLARQPQARAELYGVVARLRLGLGDYREANALLDQQLLLLRELPDAPASLRLEAATLRGNTRRLMSDAKGCLAQMQTAQRPGGARAGTVAGAGRGFLLAACALPSRPGRTQPGQPVAESLTGTCVATTMTMSASPKACSTSPRCGPTTAIRSRPSASCAMHSCSCSRRSAIGIHWRSTCCAACVRWSAATTRSLPPNAIAAAHCSSHASCMARSTAPRSMPVGNWLRCMSTLGVSARPKPSSWTPTNGCARAWIPTIPTWRAPTTAWRSWPGSVATWPRPPCTSSGPSQPGAPEAMKA